MTVGFLTPCHSTPWRSHLIHPGIKAWALTCDPPLHLNASARSAYIDEADQFYADPVTFLSTHLGAPPPSSSKRKTASVGRSPPVESSVGRGHDGKTEESQAWDGGPGPKRWPEYLVFFEQLEDVLGRVLRGSRYQECWRGWNSWGHDDWRRKGDVVIWCLR
jgi:phosphatidylinositol glycan class B